MEWLWLEGVKRVGGSDLDAVLGEKRENLASQSGRIIPSDTLFAPSRPLLADGAIGPRTLLS